MTARLMVEADQSRAVTTDRPDRLWVSGVEGVSALFGQTVPDGEAPDASEMAERLALDRADLDLADGRMAVRHGKGNKARRNVDNGLDIRVDNG